MASGNSLSGELSLGRPGPRDSVMFDVYVLPAHRGDALDRIRTVVVDGGITKTGREALRAMIDARQKPLNFELLVITHIDLDHIEGIIEILQDLPPDISFKEICFNGWDQLKLVGLELFGVKKVSRSPRFSSKGIWRPETNRPTGK
jgi:glyoxylase-like metal-dependent hydrolase (beta-lactamase superfamily II)